MKKSFFAVLAAITLLAGNAVGQLVGDLDDLNYWGSGTNRIALVIQWNDSKSPGSLAWGYRWSGTQTVGDMLTYLAANDSGLFLRIDSSTGFGMGIFGIGYQTGASPFGVTGAEDTGGSPVTPTFTAGINDLNTNPASTQAPASSAAASPTNAADRYAEGWNDTGFWELYNSGSDNSQLQSSFALPTTWTASFVGSSTALVDGSWAAFSFAPGFASAGVASSVTAAVPEPGSLGLLGFAAGAFWIWKRRRSPRG